MKKFIRAASLFIAFISVVSLCGCAFRFNFPKKQGGEQSGEETADNTEVTEPIDKDNPNYVIVENDFTDVVKRHLNSIGKADYEGAAVMIATPKPSIIDEEERGTVLSEMVANRNMMVEEHLGVSIYAKNVDADTMYAELFNAERAGDYYVDILTVPQYYMSQYVVSGLLFNLNSLPFFDTSAGYNIESGASAGMAASRGYGVAGWGTLEPDLLSAVFFNKEIIEEAGLEAPYELVKRNEWTWDKFFEYTAQIPVLRENGEGLGELSSYGFQDIATSFADIIFASEGNSFITAGIGVIPQISVTYDNSLHAMTTAQTLFNDPYKNRNSLDAISTFANGGSMFLIDRLGTAKTIANSDAVWGVVPLPKGSVEQAEYRTLASNESLMFAVPAGCNNAEVVSRVITSLNAASIGYSVDAYVTDYMYYYLRDNESANMVEKICYSAYFDMAYTFGSYDTAIANSTYFAARNVYECNGDMNFYLTRFQNRGNSALRRIFP